VSHHDARDAPFEKFFEGVKLEAVEALLGEGNQGQVGMRIRIRIAVAGKVFGAADGAAVFHAFVHKKAFDEDVFAVFSE
jgi:hypothetical protein